MPIYVDVNPNPLDISEFSSQTGLFIPRWSVDPGAHGWGRLRPTVERQVRGGHPWVYAEAIASQSHAGATGDFAVLFDGKKRFLALGQGWMGTGGRGRKVAPPPPNSPSPRNGWDGLNPPLPVRVLSALSQALLLPSRWHAPLPSACTTRSLPSGPDPSQATPSFLPVEKCLPRIRILHAGKSRPIDLAFCLGAIHMAPTFGAFPC